MRASFTGWFFVVLFASGCGPNLKAIASGRIGCPESEIDISDENGDTWTATCRGQTFYCSSAKSDVIGSVGTKPFYGVIDGNYACHIDTRDAQMAARVNTGEVSDGHPTVRSLNPPLADPPTGAFGFELDGNLEAAQQACLGAQYAWSGSGELYTCSGTPKSVGLTARTRIRSCSAKVCEIDLVGRPERGEASGWTTRFVSLADSLKQKYGDPNVEERKIPPECRNSLQSCIKAGTAYIKYQWIWSKDRYIVLTAWRAEGEPVIELVYRHMPVVPEKKIDGAAL
jgi:hypothetical protein